MAYNTKEEKHRRVKLTQIYLKELAFCLGKRYKDDFRTVSGLSYDSRRCENGHLFFCKGAGFRAEYAAKAKKRGACAIVCEAETAALVKNHIESESIITVQNIGKAMAECAAYFYKYPMRSLISVAVTGTKGKTTTVHYINSAINRQKGMKCAVLSELVDGDAPRLTTPEAIDLHAAAAKAVKNGCTHIVCEISSQAQKLGRAQGITFDIGCFLNLGNDHISKSEHADMQEYFECKRSLFDNCKVAVVNVDDEYGRVLCDSLPSRCRRVRVSALYVTADYHAENIQTDGYGCDLSVKMKENGKQLPLLLCSIGEHNALNALSAAAALKELGISDEAILLGIAAGEPRGRGERFTSRDEKVTVIVDYAHNEMSFAAMFKMAKKEFAGAIVTVIFGCPGDKAHCRRRQLAQLCTDNADKVTVCEDDSGTEGYESISASLRGCFGEINGTRLEKGAVSYIKSREQALRAALDSAADGEEKHLILMLGKGNENVNRGCGCDEACVPDTVIARKEINRYDNIALSRGALEKLVIHGAVTVCITDGADTDALVNSFSYIARTESKGMYAVCQKSSANALVSKCYKNGIATLIIEENEVARSIKSAAIKAEKANKMGSLPIFTCSSRLKRYSIKISVACGTNDLVYLTLDKGILFNRKIAAKKLNLRRAMLINEALHEKDLEYVRTALRSGVKSVAFINGSTRNSLLSYLISGNCDGIALCGE